MTQYLHVETVSQEPAAPEIREALRAARYVHSRLEDEFEPFGWEQRLELAHEMRLLIEDAPEEVGIVSLARAVEFHLESETCDLEAWEERLDTANLVSALIAGLRQIGGEAR